MTTSLDCWCNIKFLVPPSISLSLLFSPPTPQHRSSAIIFITLRQQSPPSAPCHALSHYVWAPGRCLTNLSNSESGETQWNWQGYPSLDLCTMSTLRGQPLNYWGCPLRQPHSQPGYLQETTAQLTGLSVIRHCCASYINPFRDNSRRLSVSWLVASK